jgi:nucleotide-binding universal stress UspA family protein
MYKKILVPLDGSEFGECSLKQVNELVSDAKATEVVLLGVVESVIEAGIIASYLGPDWQTTARKKITEGTEAYLATTAEKLRKSGMNVKTVTVQGNASEKILDYAANNKVDLIVISTHGQSGIVRWAIGSVADKVMRHSSIPVLLAAPKACR